MTQQKAASLTSSLFARKGKASPAGLLISELRAADAGAAPAGEREPPVDGPIDGRINSRANGHSGRRKTKPPAELPLLALVEAQTAEEAAIEVAPGPAPAASLLERSGRSLRRANGRSGMPPAEVALAGETAAQAAAETAARSLPEPGGGVDEAATSSDDERAADEAVEAEVVCGDANVTAIEDAPQDEEGRAEAPAESAAAEIPPVAATPPETAAVPDPQPEPEPEPEPASAAAAQPAPTEMPSQPPLSASQALRKAVAMHGAAAAQAQVEKAPEAPVAPSPVHRGANPWAWRSAALVVVGAGLGLGLYVALGGQPSPGPVEPAPAAAPVVAAVEPAPARDRAETPAPAVIQPEPAAPAAAPEPSFDIIRIEPDGQSIIAGRAAPGSEWILLNNGQPIAVVQADLNGEWVVLPDGSLVPGANAFSLVPKAEQGRVALPAPAASPAEPAPDTAPAEPAVAPEAAADGPRAEAAPPLPDLPRRKPEQVQAAGAPEAFHVSAQGLYEVQLASVRESADADRERLRLAEAFPSLLSEMDLRVQEARLEEAGVFYRVRSGALDDLGVARDLCRRLEAAGQGCLVVRRPPGSAPEASPEQAANALAEDLPAAATPDGATPDGATPDGATPDGAGPVRQQAERPLQ